MMSSRCESSCACSPCCCLLLVAISPSYALDYPTRPVRFIVSFAAGGPNDTIARILGQYLSEQLGQQFIIEDHVGAGGNIGMQDVLASAPDGYTIGFVAPNNAINHTLYAAYPVRLRARLHADRRHHEARQCHGGEPRFPGQNACRVHRHGQGASRARSISPPAASAPRRTCPASCWRS